MFVGVHALAAQLLTVPELEITESEGKAFTDAAKNVMRHYSVTTTQKTIDWIALIGTAGGIYGTRIAAYNIRKRNEANQRQRPPLNVVHMTPPTPPAPQPAPAPIPPKPNGGGQPVPVVMMDNTNPVITPALPLDPYGSE